MAAFIEKLFGSSSPKRDGSRPLFSVSRAYQDLSEVPQLPNGRLIEELNLSHNELNDFALGALERMHLPRLRILVLDHNHLTGTKKFPRLPSLEHVSVNANQISNLTTFMDKLVRDAPNLKYLSMLNNAACPNYFNGGTPGEYSDYRLYVIYRLPKLLVLDDKEITEKERKLSNKMYSKLGHQRGK